LGNIFCIDSNSYLTKSWNYGVCCASDDQEQCEEDFDYCTSQVGDTKYNSLRVVLCPNDDHCYGKANKKYNILDEDGGVLVLQHLDD